MTTKKASKFRGHWRIVETGMWEADALDLDGTAHIVFKADGIGELGMVAIHASVDHRETADRVEFSWAGFDDGDPVSGRGFAAIVAGRLAGMIFIHCGDESSFVAERMASS